MKANMRTPDALMTESNGGLDDHDSSSGRTNAAPITTNSTSGTSLAATAISTRRAPPPTLRILIAPAAINTAAMNSACTRADDVPINAAADAANADATAAAAASALRTLSTPVRNPASGPNAV